MLGNSAIEDVTRVGFVPIEVDDEGRYRLESTGAAMSFNLLVSAAPSISCNCDLPSVLIADVDEYDVVDDVPSNIELLLWKFPPLSPPNDVIAVFGVIEEGCCCCSGSLLAGGGAESIDTDAAGVVEVDIDGDEDDTVPGPSSTSLVS